MLKRNIMNEKNMIATELFITKEAALKRKVLKLIGKKIGNPKGINSSAAKTEKVIPQKAPIPEPKANNLITKKQKKLDALKAEKKAKRAERKLQEASEAAEKTGFKKGRETGFKKGSKAGFATGNGLGHQKGVSEGMAAGEKAGFATGNSLGKQEAKSKLGDSIVDSVKNLSTKNKVIAGSGIAATAAAPTTAQSMFSDKKKAS